MSNDLKAIAQLICNRHGYEIQHETEKSICLSLKDKIARIVIVDKDNNANELDVTFSLIVPPSESATLMQTLNKMLYVINVNQDFYCAQNKKIYQGEDAITQYQDDIYAEIEVTKYKSSFDDGKYTIQ